VNLPTLSRSGRGEPLPKDAVLVELRTDRLSFSTRQCLLPGTLLSFRLVMEGRPLALTVATSACLVTAKDRKGYVYQPQVSLDQLSEGDRQLITLFIAKGRGAAEII
jgi:hypothetical protein